MLDPYIDSPLIHLVLILGGLALLTYPQWLPWIRGANSAGKFDSLISRLEALGDQLAAEAKTGQPPSMELTRAVSQAMSDLQAFKIQHPNWHSLSVWPILAWLPYVDKLLPALRRQNLREACDAINHVDMAGGLKP